MHQLMGVLGIEIARSPLNLSFVFALLCCLLFWLFVWQTRYGYALGAGPERDRCGLWRRCRR